MDNMENAGDARSARERADVVPFLVEEDNSLSEALEEARTYLSAAICLLLLYDNILDTNEREARRLRQVRSIGISARSALEFEKLANNEPFSGYLATLADPVVSNNGSRNGLAPVHDWAAATDVSSFALVPLAIGAENRGILLFCASGDHRYTGEDAGTLRLVGKMASLVVSNSHPETKDRFISALSHELRTPLTSIIGFTQIIRKRLSNSPDRDERLLGQVDVLWSQAQRLNRLIDTFVDVSRLENGQFAINPGRVEIVSTLKEAVEQSRAQARSKHHITYDLPDHRVEVFADVRRLDQVFNQVLSNAIRFSPENQPITVSCEDREAEGIVVISVTDLGPGIPQSRIQEIFERFAASEPLRAGGLGVGLYISKSIVEAHGGSMSLESSAQRGTTVRIVLPK
jgi:signal transduction histidine kinase